jgi:hypothetical protein
MAETATNARYVPNLPDGISASPLRDSDYVAGKLRQDGVLAFLMSRGITLPEGSPDDPPESLTVRQAGPVGKCWPPPASSTCLRYARYALTASLPMRLSCLAESSASTTLGRPKPYAATVPTWWSPISASCWRSDDRARGDLRRAVGSR